MTWQIFGATIQTSRVDDGVELSRTDERFVNSFDFDEETNGVIGFENFANDGPIEPESIADFFLLLQRADEERHLLRVVQVIDNRAILLLTPAQVCLGRDVRHQMMLALIAETFHL